MSSSEARRGVPTSNGNTATAKDYAFSNASDVDANSRISQNAENVNNGITRLVDLGYDDRASAIHEISDIKRTTIDSNEPVRRDNFRKNSGSQSPDR